MINVKGLLKVTMSNILHLIDVAGASKQSVIHLSKLRWKSLFGDNWKIVLNGLRDGGCSR